MTPRNTTVQRITQYVHPVSRAKKKQLLAHVIKEHDWSQVLVFTRTKFGANNVAEFLSKNGINAMALHGNKSQSARTQALGGFKSGDIRALVATDIAARGIDIDDLPHVVNFEIPNVPEDYVHRIGRTGRAGAEGQAVSFVCLDEEGFMKEIERFTKQQIPTRVVEGFAPEPGERAEPIAMGRQTIWGGLGKPPSRDVMHGRRQGRAPGNDAAHPRQQGRARRARRLRQRRPQRRRQRRPQRLRCTATAMATAPQRQQRRAQRCAAARPARAAATPRRRATRSRSSRTQNRQREDHDDDRMPSNIDPLRTNMPGRRDMNGVQRVNVGGQPDPTRTSIDSMGAGGVAAATAGAVAAATARARLRASRADGSG